MNEYTKHHINLFYKKYCDRTFDQDDLAIFIMLIRDYTPKKSIFRELGDFLAHPDKKDRGIVIESYDKTISMFDQDTLAFFDKPWSVLESIRPSGLGLSTEIYNDLSCVFALNDLTCESNNINDLPFRDLIFCLIFLLSNFKLKINGKLHEMTVDYGHSISLTVAYESKTHQRNFVELPVIFLPNVHTQSIYINFHQQLKNHIARRFNNGLLAAIPYEIDTDSLCESMYELKVDTVWYLPNYK